MALARILLPLDGTPQAAAALPLARGLAAASGAKLNLVRVVSDLNPRPEAVSGADRYLERIERELRGGGLVVDTRVLFGDPAEKILRHADESRADLVVLTTRKAGLRRLMLGSVTTQVLQRSPVPVVVLRPGHRRVTRLGRVLVPLDGTPDSARVLPAAAELARATAAAVVLLRVIPATPDGPAEASRLELNAFLWAARAQAEQELEKTRALLKRTGLPARAIVWGGPIAQTIVRAAQAEDTQLIALATHARSTLGRALLGSIADEVVHRSEVPVLVVSLAATRESVAG